MNNRHTLRLIVSLGTLLTTLAVIAPATAEAAPRFEDVPDGHVFQTDIEWLADEAITRGCNPPTNDRFCPDAAVTREQMAAFLVRALNLTDDGGGNKFTDDDSSIFETDIAKLAAAKITLGCNPPTNDQFCPTDVVTREQMAAFLVRALNLTDDGGGNKFTDDDSSIFEADIAKLAAARITLGCNPPTNDQFCPTDVVTRGQMAAFLRRALPDQKPAVDVDTVTDGQTVDMSGAGTGTGSFTLGGTLAGDIVEVRVSLGSEFGFAKIDSSSSSPSSEIDGSAPDSGQRTNIDSSSSPPTWEIDASAPDTGQHTYVVVATDRAGRTATTEITLDVIAPDPDELLLDPDVVIIDGDTPGLVLVSYTPSSGSVVLAGDVTDTIEVDSVLVGQRIAGLAPNGFLRRVTGVSIAGTTTVATTVQATLLEAIRQASQGMTGGPAIPQAVAKDSSAPSGIFDGRYGVGIEGTIPFSKTLTNPGYPGWSVSVAGQASAAAEMFIDIDKRGTFDIRPVLRELIISTSGDLSGSIGVTGTASTGFGSTETLASQQLGAASIGPVPVTLEGEIIGEVYGNATGTVGVSGDFGLSFEALAHRIDGVTTTSKDFTPSGDFDLTAQVDLEAGVGLKMQAELLIADAVGPSLTVGPELIAQASIDLIERIVPWTVRVDLVADLGITGQIPVFDIEFLDESFELWRGTLATLASGTIQLAGPHLTVTKTLESNDDLDQSGGVSARDTLTYEITLVNDGNADLTDTTVTDPLDATLDCTESLPLATFAPGSSVTCEGTYTVTKGDVTVGAVDNTALATATDTSGATLVESSTVHTPTQSPVLTIALAKTHTNVDEDGSNGVTEDDTLTYSIEVSNTGNLALVGIEVTDPLLPDLACNGSGSLFPGETLQCSGDYVVTIDDIDSGSVQNTATVNARNVDWGRVSDTDADIAPAQVQTPSIWVAKWLASNSDEDASGDMTPGDTLIFGIQVANNGTTALTSVTIDDPLVPTLECDATLPVDFAIGESFTCSATYVVTEDDYDARFVTNTVTTTGLDPDLNQVTDQAQATVERTKPYVEEVLAAQPSAYWRMGDSGNDLVDSVGPFDATAGGNNPYSVSSFVGATNDGAMNLGCCDTHGGVFPPTGSEPLASEDFSFEMWIRAKQPMPGGSALIDIDGVFDLQVTYDEDTVTTVFELVFEENGNVFPMNVSVPGVTDATHLVVVRDGNEVNLYLDGESAGTLLLPDSTRQHLPSMMWRPEAVEIDEMAWYGRALNSDEIGLHYRIGANPGTLPVTRTELISIFETAGFDMPESKADSFNGLVFEWDTQVNDSFYRYTNSDSAENKGLFLTGEIFGTPAEAVDALYLAIWGNHATYRQTVTANVHTTTYVGYIAGGEPHGYKQYVLLDIAEFTYSAGVPY